MREKDLAHGLVSAQKKLAVVIDNSHLGSLKITQVPKLPCPDKSE